MTTLPAPLGGGDGLVFWRIDRRIYEATWDSGEGAFRDGGRWNSEGVVHAVYCSLDPATPILEIAVHTGFEMLDTVPHVITAARIRRHRRGSCGPTAATCQTPIGCGRGFRARANRPSATIFFVNHRFVAIPSAVSTHSWNLIFDPVEGQRLLSPGAAGAVRARHALAPAGGLAVSFQEVVHSVWTVDADVAKPQ